MNPRVIKNRWRLVNALLRRSGLCLGVPQEIIIEVTNRCNLRCPMCIRTHRKINERDLSLEEFHRLIENITPETERIAIAGLGEPLLHLQIVEMVYQCNKRGFKTVLYTNATLLNPELSLALLNAGLSSVIFSFDGATSQAYEHYRRGANFYEVKKNILEFLEIKRNISSKVYIEIQMILLKYTLSQIKEFIHMWSLKEIDSIRIKNDHMGVLYEENGKNHSDFKIKKGICAMPWRGPATISVTGELFPCCVASEHNVILGNVFDDNIEKLWHSDLANELRNKFANKRTKLSTQNK